MLRGRRFADWLPETATDWSCWQGPADAEFTCEACSWACSGRPEKPPALGSGQFPHPLRLLAHVWDAVHGWRWYTRGEKRALRDALLGCLALPLGTAWFAAVPVSGQKHSVLYCPINYAGLGVPVVAFELERVRLRLQGTTWPCLALVQELFDTIEQALDRLSPKATNRGWAVELWADVAVHATVGSHLRLFDPKKALDPAALPRLIAGLGTAWWWDWSDRVARYQGRAELELAIWLVPRPGAETDE